MGTDIEILLCKEQDRQQWDAFIEQAQTATICHHFLWQPVIQAAYHHPSFYLLARAQGQVVGALPLVRVKSWLLGGSLTSMPFLDYGGVCTDDEAVAQALVRHAQHLMHEQSVACVELRQRVPTNSEGNVRLDKVGMVLDLSSGVEALWTSLPAKTRNQVRKAQKSGLTVVAGGEELLDEFYGVFVENMRDLGSPVHHKKFFAHIFAQFGEQVRLFVVRDQQQPIGGLVSFFFRDTVTVPWASALRRYISKCPNNLLYWEALQYACAHNYRQFDFGRSSIDSGTYAFKKQWGAKPVQVYWQLLSRGGNTKSVAFSASEAKYKIVIEAWKRLPVPVSAVLGPAIRRYLTN
jgi:FemAB-related protein (PEP-CTERM system-associated)